MQKSFFLGLVITLGLSLFSLPAIARENVTNWYIQDFRAAYDIHTDSTMTVTEWITADCGQCVGKHGIFRILPVVAKTPEGSISTPVDLVSITDFDGKAYKFTTSENTSDDTVTWKIGDPDKTVTGVNQYKIVYNVKNVIRNQGTSDEWYWNVVGNFWDIPIDAFSATIFLPDTVNKDSSTLDVYSGGLGNTNNLLAETNWTNTHTLGVKAIRGFVQGEGITVSLSFPKGLFTLYQFSWWELYGKYLWFVVPIVVFVYLYRTWSKYGDDPNWNKPIIPEYEIPTGLNMLTMGSLMKNGRITTEHITAAIVELAVKGVITVRKETEKILFLSKDSYTFEKHIPQGFVPTAEQSTLLETVFATSDTVKLSDLKYKFQPIIADITKRALTSLVQQGFVERKGFTYRNIFLVVGFGGIFLFGFFGGFGWTAVVALGLTTLLFIVVSIIMPKRTIKGVEAHAYINGLKLYMETAEKYRQQFYEKEGMFETLLPVAILFGMTKEWIKKMEAIYGADYFASYHPVWFTGSFDGGFNTESFTSAMESISTNIASNMGTSSGASGGGSSGGGGGGGGGGGW